MPVGIVILALSNSRTYDACKAECWFLYPAGNREVRAHKRIGSINIGLGWSNPQSFISHSESS